MISKTEHLLINTYCMAEISGALIIGRWVRKVEDPYLITQLMLHCEEEVQHGVRWTNLLKEFGLTPFQIHASHGQGNSYFNHADEIKDIFDLLCFVHAYEKRVPFHLSAHAEKSTTDQLTKNAIVTFLQDEVGHLQWVKEYLVKNLEKHPEIMDKYKHFTELEEKSYNQTLQMFQYSKDPELEEFAKIISSKASLYNNNLQ